MPTRVPGFRIVVLYTTLSHSNTTVVVKLSLVLINNVCLVVGDTN